MDADAVTGWESCSTLILWTGSTGYTPLALILADHPWSAPRAVQSRCGEYLVEPSVMVGLFWKNLR